MKLQNMTVIFSIIVIPVTLILSAYIGVQIDTAQLQQMYDTKLMDATHDALAAFELNTINNKYSNNADSIRRDVQAAINTFSTSLATGMGISGANSSYIMPYIPALVFTLYDGYYIYSPNEYTYEENGVTKTGYEHILKPYIHYSVRYKTALSDIVINYSLDNYITVYGNISGVGYIAKSGYLIDLNKVVKSGNEVTGYRVTNTYTLQTNIVETLSEKNEEGQVVTRQSDSVKKYYQEAYEFTNWLLNEVRLQDIVRPQNAVKSDGSKYEEFVGDNTSILNISSTNDPENRESAFNQHKREIMRISIQENLNNAIKVYNEHSPSMGTHANFQMPVLTDLDWEKLLTNINIISFMEGIPVGTKIYNNYAIVTSTQNKQYINPNSIYFIDNTNTYHRINCPVLEQSLNSGSNLIGYKSIDFRKMQSTVNDTTYYYKHQEYACYTCIVNTLDEDINVNELSNVQLQAYYSAIARERYDLDKITKMLK